MSNNMKAVVLAGGSGSRLWPMSRQRLPKQFLNISGDDSMLGGTVARLSPLIAKEDVWVITGEKHAKGEAFSELEGLHQILEPSGRNTAPAVALSAALLLDLSDDDPVIVMLPADHIVLKTEAFQECLRKADRVARSGQLVTFGIVPDQPETGFGYIQTEAAEDGTERVLRFVEKPDKENAQNMLDAGNYYWNSGMFVWQASVILAEVEKHLPEVWSVLQEMRQRWNGGEAWQDVVDSSFDKMPDISIDYGVMERSENVSLVAADIGWSDVGSWDAVHEIANHDANGNEIKGNVLAIDCKNSLIRSGSRLIAAVGLENVIVVDTPDAILLANAGESQRVRELVDTLKKGDDTYHIEHATVRYPWGTSTTLESNDDGSHLKRLQMAPGAKLDLELPEDRFGHWIVMAGTATVTTGDQVRVISSSENAHLSSAEAHSLENHGQSPVSLIEVQAAG